MNPVTLLQNKRIVLGVSGSIAAYKAADLSSKLTQAGALVDVVLTEAAQRFITPLTFQALTGRPVYTNMWQADTNNGLPTHIAHVGIAEGADILIIAPATANLLAKLAHGLADDLLSVTALAARCPILVSPAMDAGMYEQRATQANIEVLKSHGITVIEPETGRFASGLMGKGRLPATPILLGHIRLGLAANGSLRGKRVVVTAGGTKEHLDPVRFISNRSSGKQGFALAQAALDVGAEVTLITTVSSLPYPIGSKVVMVETATEMSNAVSEHVATADVLIMAAAVSDFRPAESAAQKIKKEQGPPTISLTANPDILLEVKAVRERTGFPQVCVGFAAESQHLVEHATDKLYRKGLDIIVVNDILASDAGFAADTNRVIILEATENQGTHQTQLDLMSKAAVSETVMERITLLIAQRNEA